MTLSKPKARLFIDFPLGPDGVAPLSQGQVHYLRNVMRMTPGNAVSLFNGQDGEWLGEIGELGKRAGTVIARSQTRPQTPEPNLWLLFALIKKDRMGFVLEKATELGVSSLRPVITQHTVVHRLKEERLQAAAIEAAEQSERLTIPETRDAVSLEKALEDWPADRRLFVLDETGGGEPVAAVMAGHQGPAAILVGPEGGFHKSELEALRQRPYVTFLTLGPRILRADTAALAALTCWQALAGDWK